LLNYKSAQTGFSTPFSEAFDMSGERFVSQPMSKAAFIEEGFENRYDTLRIIREES
jgi:hypothetical protein